MIFLDYKCFDLIANVHQMVPKIGKGLLVNPYDSCFVDVMF